LKEFEYTNPHCWLHVSAVDSATGRTAIGHSEMGSVGQVAADGWKADIHKAKGDKITVEAHPMKDGSRVVNTRRTSWVMAVLLSKVQIQIPIEPRAAIEFWEYADSRAAAKE
jgi:hypothetical protein